jgi:hypothetical protein
MYLLHFVAVLFASICSGVCLGQWFGYWGIPIAAYVAWALAYLWIKVVHPHYI